MRYLPYVLLACLWAILFDLLVQYPDSPLTWHGADGQAIWKNLVRAFGYSIPEIIVLLALSHHFGRIQAGIISSGYMLVAISVAFVANKSTNSNIYLFLLSRVALGFTYVLWAGLLVGDRRSLRAWIYFLIMAGWSIFTGGILYTIMDFLNIQSTGADGTSTSMNPFVSVISGIVPVIMMVVLAESYQKLIVGKFSDWNPRKIELKNIWQDWQAWVLFVFFRIAILLGALNLGYAIVAGARASSGMGPSEFASYSQPALIMNFVSGLLLFLFVLYCYRKFVLEYFFQKGYVPSFLYLFMHSPVINMILFPAVLVSRYTRNITERIETFEQRSEPSRNWLTAIRVLMTIGQVLALFMYMVIYINNADEELGWLHVMLWIGILLNIVYIFYRPTIWAVFFWNLFLVAICWYGNPESGRGSMLSFGGRGDESLLILIHPILGFAWTFVNWFMSAGVLHSEYFDSDTDDAPSTDDDAPDALISSFAPDLDA
jgi:hypothetical protein